MSTLPLSLKYGSRFLIHTQVYCNISNERTFKSELNTLLRFDINFKVSSMLLISYPTYKVCGIFCCSHQLGGIDYIGAITLVAITALGCRCI
jgi:hypothetical protein